MGKTKTKLEKWGDVEVTMPRRVLEDIKKQKKDEGIIEGRIHAKPSPDTITLFKTMGEEIKEIKTTLQNVLLSLEGLPQRIFEKADDRYACKKTEIDLSTLATKIEKKDEKSADRNYDWIKQTIVTLIGIAVMLLMSKLIK